MVSTSADLFSWGDKDGNLILTQGTSLLGHSAQQRTLRVMAQGAALQGAANSKLRRV